MYSAKELYSNYFRKVVDLVSSVNIETEDIENLDTIIQQTELVVPVVGAFNAGKSTLINSILEKSYLSVDMTPETALATEVRYTENDERIEAVKQDGSFDRYSLTETGKLKDNASKYQYSRIYINNSLIQELYPLILVDMPGFEAPLQEHNKAIQVYLSKGVHFMVLLDSGSGTITRTMINELEKIYLYNRECTFFLSKCNLRSASEITEIREKLEEELEDILDKKHSITPLYKDSGEILHSILKTISPDILLKQLFTLDIANNYEETCNKLDLKSRMLSVDVKDAEKELHDIKKTIEIVEQNKEKTIKEIEEEYSIKRVDAIIDMIKDDLNTNAEMLAPMFSNKDTQGFNSTLTAIIEKRMLREMKATGEKLNTIVIDNLHSYVTKNDVDISSDALNRVGDTLKGGLLSFANNMQGYVQQKAILGKGLNMWRVGAGMAAILTAFAVPAIELVIIFLPDIINGVKNMWLGKGHEQKKIEEELRMVVFPKLLLEIYPQILASFQAQVDIMLKSVIAGFEEELQKQQVLIEQSISERKEKDTEVQIMIDRVDVVKTAIEKEYKIIK